jgi:DNA repair photolyase
MALGTNTDPYQPIEGKWRITRSVLEVLAETRHPFTITTKSDRVVRDIDIIAPMAAQRLANVAISITSLTPEVSRTLEPRAPAARKRLAAVKMLVEAGVPCIVAIAPVVPQVTTTSWRRSSPPRRRRARSASSTCRCGSRTKWRHCSAPGSTNIMPSARPR